MNKKPSKKTLLIIGLVLLTLSCQSVAQLTNSRATEPTPTIILRDKPLSTFVPPRSSVEARVNEPLEIESYHVNDRPLAMLQVFVNGQKEFPSNLATVQMVVDDQLLTTNSLTPEVPTSNWTVKLLWTGHVPGTYELSLKVTDVDGRTGDPIAQRIEVR